MKKSLILPLAISLTVSWCNNINQKTEKDISDNFNKELKLNTKTNIVYNTNSLTANHKQIIESAINDYVSSGWCNLKELTISDDISLFLDEEGPITLAYWKPWIININPKIVNNVSDAELSNIIVHELFHSIKPSKPTATNPYKLSDWYNIVWFHWLSILVSNWKENTQFGIIEDAAAEACAAKFKPDYIISNVYYANVWSLMLKMISRWWLTVDDLIKAQTSNDIYFIVSKILNKDVKNDDIEKLMWIFNKLYSTDKDITNNLIGEIETIRNK